MVLIGCSSGSTSGACRVHGGCGDWRRFTLQQIHKIIGIHRQKGNFKFLGGVGRDDASLGADGKRARDRGDDGGGGGSNPGGGGSEATSGGAPAFNIFHDPIDGERDVAGGRYEWMGGNMWVRVTLVGVG